MSDTKKLIKEFNESKVGKVVNGKESFRSGVGRILHGLSYKYPKLAMVMGVMGFMGSTVALGPVGAIAASPMMFAGVYSGIVPKKEEKVACDFLMNVAVRKTAAFNNYLEKRGVDEKDRLAAVREYLKNQAPKFGYFKEYQKDFPNAAEQIMKEGMKGELPLLHGRELYELEALQEVFTKGRNKDGILKGMVKTFTPTYRAQRKEAKKIADARWADRKAWLEAPEDKRGPWREFMKGQAFIRSKENPKKEEKKTSLLSVFKKATHPLNIVQEEKAYIPIQKEITSRQMNVMKNRYGR